MRRSFRILLLLLAGSARAAAAVSAELPAGRYSISVDGMLCRVCARAIEAEWAKLPAVEKVSVDYETGAAAVTIRLGQALTLAALRKALSRADKIANLGRHFEMSEPRNVP